MPVANKPSQQNRPKRHTSDTRPHKRNKNKKRKGKRKNKTKTWWNLKLNHEPKKRQRRRSFIPGDLNWKFFQVGYPVDTHTNIPKQLQDTVIKQYHDDNGHMGIDKTFESIKRKYYFPNLYQKLTSYVNACVTCQTRALKKQRPPL